ncbi:hypothetical protein TTHERM_00314960 (macronuclear) [Tetrahymena thermophila SB210]|uniref:Uncharacterized protein n=1 Tax=Tetrahymena thermophila (strain SB210) TaxID=312017 RepID=I7LW64_TETTS|nr:hypothetical protein TTHERM_00314960 [Tetrahymena thermophila SB210]EAS01042.2 hypothetical protein TTHERM_00314960 [Tetrahymena thermophila SB210]|eukprot:XP_001021287.2 hypothetical protein TTHERM_00314960 [Tetrahymena thermophila SB210]
MRRDNRSCAQTFTLQSDIHDILKKKFCEFIVNVNTSAEKNQPYFSLTSVCQIYNPEHQNDQSPSKYQQKKISLENQNSYIKNQGKMSSNFDQDEKQTIADDFDKDSYLIALKTEKSIAVILQSKSSAKLLLTMDLSDKFTLKKNICYHSFVYNRIQDNSQLQDNIKMLQSKSANSSQRQSLYQNNQDQEEQTTMSTTQNSQFIPESPDIYICFQTGYILVMNSLTSHFLYNFNNASEKGDQVWHQKKITKVCTMPDQKSFLVLFSDSVIMQYSLNSKSENHAFQEEILKQLESVSFQPKKFGQSIQRKSYGTYQYSSISEKDFVGFACYYNDEDAFCGPHKFFKFKCPSISDFAILPYEHPLYKLVNGKYSKDPLLVAFSGLDGLLRVVDLINFQAVYCFKNNYGGIHSFSFEKNDSPIISLSCQDDSVIVLNTRLNTYIRITGHISFVTYSVFTHITDDLIRITAGSYDGYISITEIPRKDLDNPEFQDVNTESYLPIKVKYQSNNAIQIKANHLQKVNEEGIAFVLGFSDYFISSAFDGCATLFRYRENMEEIKQESDSNQEGSQSQTDSQNQPDHRSSQRMSQSNSQSSQLKYQNQDSYQQRKQKDNYQNSNPPQKYSSKRPSRNDQNFEEEQQQPQYQQYQQEQRKYSNQEFRQN